VVTEKKKVSVEYLIGLGISPNKTHLANWYEDRLAI